MDTAAQEPSEGPSQPREPLYRRMTLTFGLGRKRLVELLGHECQTCGVLVTDVLLHTRDHAARAEGSREGSS